MKKTDFDQDLINTLHSLKRDEDVNPSVSFRENTKVRLMNLISDQEKVLENKPSFVFIKNPKFAFRLAGIFLIILVFIFTGTILAAQSATPKNQLYPVKLASEEIALKLSPSSSLKANIAVEIVRRRASEIDSEKQKGNKSEIKQGITRYKNSIEEAKKWNPQSLLRDDEKKLESLTTEYNNSTPEEKVKGASDSNINSSGQNLEQKRETKLPTEQQNNNQETIREETKTQSSTPDSLDRTIQNLTATSSAERH